MSARLTSALRTLVPLVLALSIGGCAHIGARGERPIQVVDLDESREAPSADARTASEAAMMSALRASSPLNGGSTATLSVRDGKVHEAGRDELAVDRDTLGKVRAISLTTYPQGGRTYTKHWFDEVGQTVAVSHTYQITLRESCARAVASWFVDIWLDGRGQVIAVEPRLPPRQDPGETGCAPRRPAGLTLQVYPDVASLLAAVGVEDVLAWDDGVPIPAAPRR